MTLLEELVFALSKNERERLRPLQFRGVKRDIVFRILKCRSRLGINAADIKRRYRLTDVRYHQILSEMLRTVYNELIPADGLDLLEFLGRKQLCRHCLHEVRRQEALMIARGDSEALADFYLRVLVLSNLLMLPLHILTPLSEALHSIAIKYVSVKEPHPLDHYFLRMLKVSGQLEHQLLKSMRRDRIEPYVAELEEIFRAIKRSDQFLALFSVNFTLLIVYSRIYQDRKRAERHVLFGKQLVRSHADMFGAFGELFDLICDLHMPSSRQAQVDRLKRFLMSPAQGPNISASRYLERFLPLIIEAGELEWAKRYIEQNIPENLERLPRQTEVHYASILTMYRIYAGDYANAEQALHQALKANMGKHRSIFTEIKLRCYDVFLHLMRNDFVRAEDVIARHIRFVRRQVEHPQHSPLLRFLKDVRELTRAAGTDSNRAAGILEKFTAEFGGQEQYVFLFRTIYAKYFA